MGTILKLNFEQFFLDRRRLFYQFFLYQKGQMSLVFLLVGSYLIFSFWLWKQTRRTPHAHGLQICMYQVVLVMQRTVQQWICIIFMTTYRYDRIHELN